MKDRSAVSFEYKKVNTKDLKIDELYQRDIDMKRIVRMAKNYDPCLVNAPKVSFRDGKYYVFDGQHTVVLEKTVRGKGKDVTLFCKVFSGLTRLDEMELFIEQNGDDSRVATAAKLKARYNFGDPDVTGMVNDAQLAGVLVDFTKHPAYNKCVAHSTVMKTFLRFVKEDKRYLYREMLSTIRRAWDGSPESFSAEILRGMTAFFLTYHGQFKTESLVKSLRKVPPVAIIREGKSAVVTSGDASYARAILNVYNRNRSTNRLEDKL